MIIKPTLILDADKCKANIAAQADKAERNGITLRPHFKTHQSVSVGRFFREAGIDKITVSSLEMAEYFAADDWNDITVAFPVNVLEYETINRLSGKITLNILVESIDSIRLLKNKLENKIGVFIKIDVGYGRTGVYYKDLAEIDELIKTIKSFDIFEFKGFLTHAGTTYSVKGDESIKTTSLKCIENLNSVMNYFNVNYPDIIASYGDTPSCSVLESFPGIDELRPGNFIFYDAMQYLSGACGFEQIALALACPVVAIHKDRNEAVIYGGAVHFSKESYLHESFGTIYGLPVEFNGKAWSKPIEGAYVSKISQEHGTITGPNEYISNLRIGDIIYIIPIHSCLTVYSFSSYTLANGEKLNKM